MRIPRTIPAGVTTIGGYPIPAGAEDGKGGKGADDTDDGDGTGGENDDGDGQDGARGSDDGQTQDNDDRSSDDGDGKGRAGGEEALRADLARERRKRQEAERRAKELETANESETEAREREIREQAQAPAIRALRSTAVETAAREARFLYPSDVYSLLTTEERDSIDVDLESEAPAADRTAAAELVEALAKRRPGLIAPDDTDEGDDDGKGAGGSDHQAGNRGNRRGTTGGSSSDPNANLRNLLRQRLNKQPTR